MWNFSCPYCGDSNKNKRKARGYIFAQKQRYAFHCHNCNINRHFEGFLKDNNLNLYNEYKVESFIEQGQEKESERFEQKYLVRLNEIDSSFKKAKKISQLKHGHIAKQYIESRLIPTNLHNHLFWVPAFKAWTNTLISNKFENSKYDEGRIIIPFYDKKEKIFGYQGRSLQKDDPVRYITIMLDENKPRFYGLDTCDYNKDVFVFEGPIDSMFIPNGIASGGGDLFRELNQLDIDKENIVIVYDNERRHKDTVSKMRKSVARGYRVCFWPETIEEKDVNDMVMKRFGKQDHIPTEKIKEYGEELKGMIIQCAKQGLDAEVEMSAWSKI
jgi:transcription elongation factor Elf1